MASSPNKITITVQPSRTNQSITVSATGRFGATSLRLTPTRIGALHLSPTTDADAYWADVLSTVGDFLAAE